MVTRKARGSSGWQPKLWCLTTWCCIISITGYFFLFCIKCFTGMLLKTYSKMFQYMKFTEACILQQAQYALLDCHWLRSVWLSFGIMFMHEVKIMTVMPGENATFCRHFICIFLNKNHYVSIKLSLKFVLRGPLSSKSVLVQVVDWCHQVTSH